MRSRFAVVLAGGATAVLVISGGLAGLSAASAAQPSVGLGKATSFAVLAGTTITNTGPTTISGDLGLSPGSAVTGFPPGQVINGTQHVSDALAVQAKSDLTTGYNDAAGRIPATTVSGDLGGRTLAPGVYRAASGLGLTGTVTLDGHSDLSAVFIFQAGSTLITASSSTVKLIGGAQACNVFWQVGSSVTLGTNSTFAGSVLALTSATVQTGATVAGRVLARNGQVSLDANTITRPSCVTAKVAASASATATASPTAKSTVSPFTPTPSGGGPVIPLGHPATGAGGATHSGARGLIVAGLAALAGAASVMGYVIRRRRALSGWLT